VKRHPLSLGTGSVTNFRLIADGLRFPEGPIALPNGDIIVAEIAAGRLSRLRPDGRRTVVATPGGGPNGAAIGPDGKCYVCNNGGMDVVERGARLLPVPGQAEGQGRIERIDLESGRTEVLYADCGGIPLKAPNDIVFDSHGGFWFTDQGKHRERERDVTGVFYAMADGSRIVETIFPLDGPNGIGLSPTEEEIYVAETPTARLWAYPLAAPGLIHGSDGVVRGHRGRLVVGLPGYQMFDSLAVEAGGNICVATIHTGGITVISPTGVVVGHVPLPDRFTTNICFGGPNLSTAFITLSSTGRIVAMDWPRPGLPLNHLNR
jgi:gluconolactonase